MRLNPPSVLILMVSLLLGARVACASTLVFDINGIIRDGSPGENTFITSTSGGAFANLGAGPSLTFSVGSLGAAMVSYFDAVSLNQVGEKVSFEFTGAFSNFNATTSLRFGLFNVNTGSLLTGDASASTSNDFVGYAGYMRIGRGTSAIADGTITQRSTGAGVTSLFTSSGGSNLATSVAAFNITNGQVYSGSFSIERSGVSEVKITTQFGSQTETLTLDADLPLVTSFNTIGFFGSVNSTFQPEIVFSKYNVTFTAVPEPGVSAVAVFGLGGGVLWARRRKSGRR